MRRVGLLPYWYTWSQCTRSRELRRALYCIPVHGYYISCLTQIRVSHKSWIVECSLQLYCYYFSWLHLLTEIPFRSLDHTDIDNMFKNQYSLLCHLLLSSTEFSRYLCPIYIAHICVGMKPIMFCSGTLLFLFVSRYLCMYYLDIIYQHF